MPKYQIVVREGLQVCAQITGRVDVNPAQDLTAEEVLGVVKAEQLLEKLTGYRVHILEAE